MPIDPNLPLEFDDGTPVQLVAVDGSGITVFTNQPERKSLPDSNGYAYWYDIETGIFGGGNAKLYKVLRNVGPREPEEYESFFV